jgi:hypothetical protein
VSHLFHLFDYLGLEILLTTDLTYPGGNIFDNGHQFFPPAVVDSNSLFSNFTSAKMATMVDSCHRKSPPLSVIISPLMRMLRRIVNGDDQQFLRLRL